ncbi:MAG: FliM/FliN family flagellar motor switch protein [Acidobacteriia bacterium]|nr:FliM/FliN family flagellar motor switch protein [Terriglobia bacterium]
MFSAPQIQPLQWTLLLSPELQAALEGASKPTAAPPPPPRPSAPPAAVAPSAPPESAPAAAPLAVANVAGNPGGQANLDLLLDVKLDAMLRFGERVMPLREILELRPGSVVELNRRIKEPAELLVSGRLVARGEVVIVDGNYGLRVTDIVHPRERLESVST